MPFEDNPAGSVVVTLSPRSREDRALLLELCREALKNCSWVEIGGGAGSVMDGVIIQPVPALVEAVDVIEGELVR